MILPIIINFGFGIILLGGAFYFWRKTAQVKSTPTESTTSAYQLISISVPRNNEKSPAAAEQMFAALHGIFRSSVSEQEHISFEIVSKARKITFFAYIPTDLKDFVLSQIYAQYPNVEITQVSAEDDYAQVAVGKAVVTTEMTLKKPTVYPIKTFLNFEVDPLSAITGVLSSVGEDEEIWTQLIIRPIDDEWQEQGEKEVKNIKEPAKKVQPVSEFLAAEAKTFAKDLAKGFIFPPKPLEEKKKEEKPKDLGGPQQQAIKGIEEKITKLGFEATLRIVAVAKDPTFARAKIEQAIGAYKQFNTLNLNALISKNIVEGPEALPLYQNRVIAHPDIIFNITELASLYHFPSETVATPTIEWAGAKKGEPPANLPILGTVPAEELTVFAQTNFRAEIRKFGIKKPDRRLHTYIIGKTGTGKSTLMENMIFDDIREGRGVAVVDPHGELISHILDLIPEDRIADVVYFNPADSSYPIGFNLLENVDPEMKNVVASGVVGIFKKIFGESWGPRLEYILRNAVLALLDYPNSTLLGVMRILTDNAFRRLVVNEIKDPVIKDFFINEYEKYEPKFRQEAIAPIQNKVGQFLSSSTIRNIVGQPKSTMDIRTIMDQGKILLADLSIGRIGEDNSALLGSMLITKIQLAAMGRTDMKELERRDFYLYVDEFQNFATDSFATILSEARKYRLNLVMINQYISQMPETVANAVFGNVGTMIAFRVGATDAEALKHEFEPVFDANDLVNLPNRQIYLKMAIDGVTMPAFSAGTLPPPAEKSEHREEVIEASRKQFTMTRDQVEEYIADWSNPIDLSERDKKPTNTQKIVTLPDAFTPAAPEKEIGEKAAEAPVEKPMEKGEQGSEKPVETNTETKPHLSTLGKKIEIIKDRFDRRWYAVAERSEERRGEMPAESSAEVPTDLTPSQSPTESIVAFEQPPSAITESGGERGESVENQHLISWEKADELGLKISQKSDQPSATKADDFEPIDEL